ncbi:MAG: TonB-dependent receptor, partial [Muribaculaceae bacterium]|nr:TonB-dependent receptor [Muribaculaceae bacterium]
FKERRNNIFMQRRIIPTQIGFATTPYANYGIVDNKGLEVEVNYNKNFGKDWTVGLRGTFTYAKNKIVEYDDPESVKGTYRSITGHSIGTLYGFTADGLYTFDDFDANGDLIESLPVPELGTKVRPGDMGFDIMHINLHKTFSTPHGGGGPGSGPVGVAAHLTEYLPNPRVTKDEDGVFHITTGEKGLGSISTFLGNFGVMMKAYAYILSLGKENIKKVGPYATLNANYIKESLKDDYLLPIEGVCKHEFVFDGLKDKSTGVTTLNVAKRLLDYGFHAPTIYFPLLFHESMMIEPTETESKETLDEFIEVMHKVAKEARENPDEVKGAPLTTIVRKLDETTAAKNPILNYHALKDNQ